MSDDKQLLEQGYQPDKKGYQPQTDADVEPVPPQGGTGQTQKDQTSSEDQK